MRTLRVSVLYKNEYHPECRTVFKKDLPKDMDYIEVVKIEKEYLKRFAECSYYHHSSNATDWYII